MYSSADIFEIVFPGKSPTFQLIIFPPEDLTLQSDDLSEFFSALYS